MSRFLTVGAAAAFGAAFHSFRSSQQMVAECASQKEVFTGKFQPFVLGEVINLAEDVAVFRFLMNDPNDEFNLVPCSTLQAHFKEGTNIVDKPMRFYTPITSNGTKGYFDLLVKKQRPGRFTEHLFSMNVGETLLFRVLQYKLTYKKDRWSEVGFIAGGTGLCPILQFMNASLETPRDKTKMRCLFANRSENKILLKGMLDEKARKHKDRLQMFYTVDKLDDPNTIPNPAYTKGKRLDIDISAQPETSPDGKKYFHGFVGHIDVPMLQATMPPPSDKTLVLVCGPDMMMVKVVGAAPNMLKAMSSGLAYQPSGAVLNNAADVSGYLGSLGFTKDMVYRF
ncbi:Oxidoreductase FAD-binding domain/Oxidoreductase NAD-binding domain containing protein, putative [Angomonas deanei]|uniref:Oxidoreductase FAD-binding domain/Oxidoreductase NAD-binding domain containing protein, putative n=1 Tax=Angomonas deanei TaxID=59799 RepID=A0A7G2C8R8_9TRYP|nr:Oxidoreductase FAD-binding domain/Oxidoreductase NAD-binding domain containing protein, putative [Angomonas deanei]